MNWEQTEGQFPDLEVYRLKNNTNFLLAEIRVNTSPALEGEFDFDMWIFGAGNMNIAQIGHIHNLEQAKYYVCVFLQTTFSLWSDELDLMAHKLSDAPGMHQRSKLN